MREILVFVLLVIVWQLTVWLGNIARSFSRSRSCRDCCVETSYRFA